MVSITRSYCIAVYELTRFFAQNSAGTGGKAGRETWKYFAKTVREARARLHLNAVNMLRCSMPNDKAKEKYDDEPIKNSNGLTYTRALGIRGIYWKCCNSHDAKCGRAVYVINFNANFTCPYVFYSSKVCNSLTWIICNKLTKVTKKTELIVKSKD